MDMPTGPDPRSRRRLPAALGEIYKTVDANGNVVFTDIAPVDRSGQPAAASGYRRADQFLRAAAAPPHSRRDAAPDVGTTSATTRSSKSFRPAEDETIRDNAGNVQIQVAIAPHAARGPPPAAGARRRRHRSRGGQRRVRAVERRSRHAHGRRRRVVDRQGNVVIESTPATFNLMRVALGLRSRTDAALQPTPHQRFDPALLALI